MNILSRQLSFTIASIALAAFCTAAQATSTDVILNLEGNPTCSSLGDNSTVLEFRDSNPGGVKTITLPIPGGSQTIAYEVVEPTGENARVVEWNITHVNGSTDVAGSEVYPINYVILKAQGGNNGARVFHFGTSENKPGAIADTDEEAPGGRMAAVSFCYGLTQGFQSPEPPISLSDLPDCETIDTDGDMVPGDLYTTGIVCPTGTDAEEQLIVNMNINAPNFGFDFNQDQIRACTCNVSLKSCNPELAAVPAGSQDDKPASERSCMEYDPNSINDRGIPDGVNDRVPFAIQGVENPDSYICYTIGGTRYCYGHY